MGKPGTAIPCQRALNQIGVRGEPPELKHLSRARKRHQPRFRKLWRANAEKAKPEVIDLWGKDLHQDQRYLVEWRGKANHRG